MNVGKIGGEKTRFNGYYGYKSPGFDINDLGFQRRADERNVSHWFQWRDNVPGRFTRSYIFNLNQYAGWNFGGDRALQRRQRQHALDVEELLRSGFGVNVERRAAARSRDARRSGGARQQRRRPLVLQRHRRPEALSFNYNGYHDTDRQGRRGTTSVRT